MVAEMEEMKTKVVEMESRLRKVQEENEKMYTLLKEDNEKMYKLLLDIQRDSGVSSCGQTGGSRKLGKWIN